MIAVPDPSTEPSAAELKANFEDVQAKIRAAAAAVGRNPESVRLVAVSKTKTIGCLQRAYESGVRVFGENYVQEICEKAPHMPKEGLEWRFIGHLQSNKAKELIVGVPNLTCVETVDSANLASKLDTAVAKVRPDTPLTVLVQVNTSGEDTKSGVEPGPAVAELCQYILEKCPHLRLAGLMTIGMPDYSPNPVCFARLNKCKEDVLTTVTALSAEQKANFELSMGMSADYENAVACGSTNVRVGSSIFGARHYVKKEDAPAKH